MFGPAKSSNRASRSLLEGEGMKSSEVIVSNHYIIKLRSQTLGVVCISRLGEKLHTWYAVNVATRREIYIRSAKRIIREASYADIKAAWIKQVKRPSTPKLTKLPNPPTGRGLYSDLANAQNDVQDTYNQMKQYVLELATRKRQVSDTTLQVVAGVHRELSLRLFGHLNTIMAICNAPTDPPIPNVQLLPRGIAVSVDKVQVVATYPMDWPYPIGPCYSTNEWEALVKAWEDGQEERDRREEESSKWDY